MNTANNSPSVSADESLAETVKSENIISEDSKLDILNSEAIQELSPKFKPFYKLTLLEMAIELKNTWFGILDDLIAGNISINTIIKDNRLFYVGVTILIFAIILYIYDYAISPSNNPINNILGGGFNNLGNGVVEIRHIYDPRN